MIIRQRCGDPSVDGAAPMSVEPAMQRNLAGGSRGDAGGTAISTGREAADHEESSGRIPDASRRRKKQKACAGGRNDGGESALAACDSRIFRGCGWEFVRSASC